MGLNKHDQIIRRRLAQKLEFLAKDLVALTPPTEEELLVYFDEHLPRYQEPTLYTFTQVFFNPDKRGDATLEDAEAARLTLIAQGDAIEDPGALGDGLMLIQLQDGSQHSAILRPSAPRFEIPLEASKLKVAGDYWLLGTVHILEGADHLLFVLALLLIVTGLGQLIKAITAFTIAHSITLALATLELVKLPAAPTEAIIALSILFLAVEIVHKHDGKIGITERWPWVVAFLFGLFHGLGFAGALAEIGVPQTEVPLALFMFNVGVESGQLLFISVVLSLITLLQRLPLAIPQRAWRIMPYSIGGLAAYWTIDRVLSFIPFSVIGASPGVNPMLENILIAALLMAITTT